jgi:hypothetical protein
MEMQLLGVYGLIVVAVAVVARRTYRTWFAKSSGGCGSGCGKCAAPPAVEAPDGKRVRLPLLRSEPKAQSAGFGRSGAADRYNG